MKKRIALIVLLMSLFCNASFASNQRIIDLKTKTSADNSDYILIDSATNGTNKISPSSLPISAATQSALDAKANSTALTSHTSNTSNPHSTTKAQVGLGNVQNVDTTSTANITDSTNKRFITDAQKTVLTNTSGTNSGDETYSTIATKLGYSNLRQAILSASVDASGNPNYITSSGLNITLNASSASPFVATVFNGFNNGSPSDIPINLTANKTFVAPANSTGYILLYNYDGSNNWNFAIGTPSPIYSFVAPASPATNQVWFNLATMQAYNWNVPNAGVWNKCYVMYLGKIITNATSVTSLQYYSIGAPQIPQAIEARHYVGNPGEPAFQNGWVNYGGVFQPVTFYKDSMGIVHLEGTIQNNSAPSFGSTIFTLPSGYIPKGQMLVSAGIMSGNGYATIYIQADGQVRYGNGWVSSATVFGLDSVTFKP